MFHFNCLGFVCYVICNCFHILLFKLISSINKLDQSHSQEKKSNLRSADISNSLKLHDQLMVVFSVYLLIVCWFLLLLSLQLQL